MRLRLGLGLRLRLGPGSRFRLGLGLRCGSGCATFLRRGTLGGARAGAAELAEAAEGGASQPGWG